MTKYVLYRRLSKEDRSKNQHGFDSQLSDLSIFLEQQESYDVIGDFQEFVSGAADHKPELEKALSLCRETGATLLVAKVDRLSRRVSQIALYLEGDVKFKVACMPQADNFQIQIYAALAEQERKFIRDRITRGLKAARDKGIKCGAASPSYQQNKAKGLHRKPKDRDTSEQRAAMQIIADKIKEIILFSNNTCTLDQIAVHLTNQGFRTPRDRVFTKGSISRIIKEFNIDRQRLTKYDTGR